MYIRTCKCGKVLSTKDVQNKIDCCEQCARNEFDKIKMVRNKLKQNCQKEWCAKCRALLVCNGDLLRCF